MPVSGTAAAVFLAASLYMLGDAAVLRPGSTFAAAAVILAGVTVFLATVQRRPKNPPAPGGNMLHESGIR